jgi:hypothetical protein
MWRLSQGAANCLLSAIFAGCMMSPANGAGVDSNAASVTFAGNYTEPSAPIVIEQLDSRRGRWEPRATTRTMEAPLEDLANELRYPFEVRAQLDPGPQFWHWTHDTKLQLTTALRARTQDSGLSTFVNHAFTSACVATQRAIGGSIDYCATGDTVELSYAVPARGASDCKYGEPDCNACVSHVHAAFERLSSTPVSKARYRSRAGELLPPFQRKLSAFDSHAAHVQGVGRLSRSEDDSEREGGDSWFALTRSTPGQPAGAGLFLVQMSSLETRFYYPIEGVDHPGGLQTFGQYAFVASDCHRELRCGSRTFVDIFDLSSLGSKRAFVQRFRVGDQGEPGLTSTVTSVAVTRLHTGHLLMFVLGKDSRHEGWFYVSDRPALSADTNWSYRGYWTLPLGKDDEYQNTSFVTECETGDIYMLGMGNGQLDLSSLIVGETLGRAAGRDSMSLLKLSAGPDGLLGMDRVATRSFDPGGDGYCSFRAAASVHASAQHELILYCSTRKSPASLLGSTAPVLKLAVFAP